jgi:hypothetical protein
MSNTRKIQQKIEKWKGRYFLILFILVALGISLILIPPYQSARVYAQTSNTNYTLLAPLPDVSNSTCDPTQSTSSSNTCTTDFLTYLGGIYRLGIAMAVILAVVYITYGGFQYVLSASIGAKENARETIQNALIGLVLALTSYLILQTINPSLTTLNFNLNATSATSANQPGSLGTQSPGTNPSSPGTTGGSTGTTGANSSGNSGDSPGIQNSFGGAN